MKGFCLITFLFFTLLAAGQGVAFSEGAMADLMAKAKAENKMVFLDCYTSWCGPCRYMSQKVFSTPEAGEFFNPKFVCVKMDMEKGEGPEWTKKLGINAYPTFVIFTPDGKEQHRIVGSADLGEFIGKVKEGINVRTSTSYKDYCYRQGERSPEFLQDYLRQLYNFKRDSVAVIVVTDLFRTLPDSALQSKPYWWLFEEEAVSPFESESFNYLVAHQDQFIRQRGDSTVLYWIDRRVEKAIETYIGWYPLKGDYDRQYYQKVVRIGDFVAKYRADDRGLKAEVELLKARFGGGFDGYLQTFQENIRLVPSRNIPNAYSGLAFCVLKTGDQKKIEEVIDLGRVIKGELTDPRLQSIMDRIFAKINETEKQK